MEPPSINFLTRLDLYFSIPEITLGEDCDVIKGRFFCCKLTPESESELNREGDEKTLSRPI